MLVFRKILQMYLTNDPSPGDFNLHIPISLQFDLQYDISFVFEVILIRNKNKWCRSSIVQAI